jgi:hypothetical protein
VGAQGSLPPGDDLASGDPRRSQFLDRAVPECRAAQRRVPDARHVRPCSDRLEIEITESLFLESSGPILEVLHGLKQIGVRIALDDFGTGFSSLSYLRRFPFDKIKIDRSFILELLSEQEASAVVKAITDLARRSTWKPPPRASRNSNRSKRSARTAAPTCKATCSASRFPPPKCFRCWRPRRAPGRLERIWFCPSRASRPRTKWI